MMARIIAVSSGKGGVGKTTITAGIGAALAAKGKKVLLIDLDMGLRNLDVVLGLETKVFYHIADVLCGVVPLAEALVTAEDRFPGLSLLPAAVNYDPAQITEERLKTLIEEQKSAYDYILLDCPAGVGPLVELGIRCAEEGISVTTPVVSAVRDADKVLHFMEKEGLRRREILVNASRAELVRKGYMMKSEEISDILGVHLLGVVPEDEEVIVYTNEGKSLVGSKTEAGKALERIAGRMEGETVPIPDFTKKKRRWLFR